MPEPPATIHIGLPFVEMESIDSTNNYALGLIHAGLAQPGMAIFAHKQVAGKGQRGKEWVTEEDTGIILTVVIKPLSLKLANQFQLSAMTALAAYHFFSGFTGGDVSIKWPNDLYWQDRKAGGILIESTVKSSESGGSWDWAIIGIGININQTNFPPNLPNPVSLKQITGKEFNPIVLAKKLCHNINDQYNELLKNGFENIYLQYLERLYKKGEIVKLKKENRLFEARIKSVNRIGQLVAEHSVEETFNVGEVEWLTK